MLEFAHRPPQDPDDISFSSTGKIVLERTAQTSTDPWDKIDALGQAVCSEIIDSFGDNAPLTLEELNPYNRHVLDQAAEILGPDLITPFANGTIKIHLSHLKASGVTA